MRTDTALLTLDCWHKQCAFHELLQGVTVPGNVVFYSDSELWAEHNRKVHGRG